MTGKKYMLDTDMFSWRMQTFAQCLSVRENRLAKWT